MLSRVRTFGIVTLFALVLWVFAESESLGEFSGLTSVRFVSPPDRSRLIHSEGSFDGSVTLELVGSKSALSRSESELARGVQLEPGMAAVPSVEGRHTVNLLEALRAYPALQRSGARVAAVSPQFVDVRVEELVTMSVPIVASFEGVEVVGEIRFTPDKVDLLAPRSALKEPVESLRVTATLDTGQRRRLPASGSVKEEVMLAAPAGLAGLPGVTLSSARAAAEFTIRARNATEVLRSVPVQVVLPPIEVGRWAVEVHPDDRFQSAEVSGSSEAVERLQSGEEALIALVVLSSDELQGRIGRKEASFVVLSGGVMSARADVQVTSKAPSVRLTIAPRAADGSP
jgi:hypothetical protein